MSAVIFKIISYGEYGKNKKRFYESNETFHRGWDKSVNDATRLMSVRKVVAFEFVLTDWKMVREYPKK
jgi:hypothetical protein